MGEKKGGLSRRERKSGDGGIEVLHKSSDTI